METANQAPVIGIIGGSGVYDIEGLSNKRWVKVDSPFGEPSDALLMGEFGGQRITPRCLSDEQRRGASEKFRNDDWCASRGCC